MRLSAFDIIKRIYKFIILLIRYPFFRLRGTHISFSSVIEKDVSLRHSTVGKYCSIGMHSYYNNAVIGNYSSIAAFVVIGAMEHSHWALSTSTHLSSEGYSDKTTIIGNDVWIGTNCIIRQGITIGTGAVIGANSFVNKDVPPYAIVFGSPARIYKYRFPEVIVNKLLQSEYWNNNPTIAKAILCKIQNDNT